MSHIIFDNHQPVLKKYLLPIAILSVIAIGGVIADIGILVPVILMAFPLLVAFVAAVFYKPVIGVIALILHAFFVAIFTRHIPATGFLNYGQEAMAVLTWIAVAFKRSDELKWHLVKNDLCLIALVWFGINIIQLFNPAGASLVGGVAEIRTTALNFLYITPLCFLLFNTRAHLNIFLILIIGCSVIAALYGMKQLYIGLDAADMKFLFVDGNANTHLLWGKLRVFSFYSDAGQFGASQAHIGLIALVLAFGPFNLWTRVMFLAAAGILMYGMLISGTRGALFAMVVGIFIWLVLSKNIKVLVLGSAIALSGLLVLKYTYIGSGNYHIHRLRTAVKPTEDASMNVRLYNQQRMREYMADHPFGGGLGVMGYNGVKYNQETFLASIPPDSFWVKIWGMFGIVGFIIWIGMMMYILGKCCGIVWNIQDKALRVKLIALTAGAGGVFICSYGNEIMNFLPSSAILIASWVFVFLGPKLDREHLISDSHA